MKRLSGHQEAKNPLDFSQLTASKPDGLLLIHNEVQFNKEL